MNKLTRQQRKREVAMDILRVSDFMSRAKTLEANKALLFLIDMLEDVRDNRLTWRKKDNG